MLIQDPRREEHEVLGLKPTLLPVRKEEVVSCDLSEREFDNLFLNPKNSKILRKRKR